MYIKDISIENLRVFAGDLLVKTYMELGQKTNEEDVFNFSLILAEDLQTDFEKLTLEDISQSFRQGIRNTKEFHLTVKTYYKWIKDHRQVIYNNEDVEIYRQDKRLNYRNRKGTGLKKLDINKSKLLK
tara:strand:+ start:1831 stop:2214 length:384 start_codon:yes stop_codon:yes gene_type:complete